MPATCTPATCEVDVSRHRPGGYCGRHESARSRSATSWSRRPEHRAGRLRPGPGRRPAVRHQLRRPTARNGHDEAAAQRPAADRHSRRTTCRGTTARRGCSATPRSPRRPASSWIARTTTPTSTRSTAGRHPEHRRGPRPLELRPRTTPARWSSPPVPTCRRRLQLPVWLARAGADVLQTHPIVAVDRRGMGMSSPIDCLDQFDRQEMRDQAQFQSGDDPVANLSDVVATTPPPTAPTPSRPATPPTTTPTPPPISSGCAALGTYPRSRWSASATAPRWRWPTPLAPGPGRQADPRLPGRVGCRRRSRRRADRSKVSRPRSTRSPPNAPR